MPISASTASIPTIRPAAASWTLLLWLVLIAGTVGAASLEDKASPEHRGEAASIDGFFRASFEPEGGRVVIGQFQSWILTLSDAAAEPVGDARIAIGGGMPGHGHGLPTQPIVSDYLGDGRYRVEGMKLNMMGQWVFAFLIETTASRDRLVLEMQIDY